MAIRTATAEWKGDLTGGNGEISGESGHLDGNYSFKSRFPEDTEGGTNPEELIAAAQAACYSMQLSAMLAEGGNTPESVSTDAKVQILKQGDGLRDHEDRARHRRTRARCRRRRRSSRPPRPPRRRA